MTDSKIKLKSSTKKREDRFVITKVTFDPLQVEIKTADTVVLLLKSEEEQVVLRAVAALDKFVSKSVDNLQSLYEMTSIMDTLMPLTSHSQLYIRRFSLKILAQMCALKPAREKLLENLEHLPYFVQVLTKEDDHFMQEFSSLILAELTSHNIACARIVDTNVLNILFDMITSKDPDIQKNSIQLMANMLRDPTTLEAFSSCKEFKFEPILSLLKSEYPVIQALAVTVLEGLTRRRHDQLMQELFRQSGGLEKLLDIIEMLEWKELHQGVLNILLNCAESPLTAQYLHSSGGLGKLLQYMETMHEPDLVEGALGVVARLANTELGRDMLHKNNMEKELCQLLRGDNSQVTGAACLGIALMTHNRHALAVIVKENPIKNLLLCLKNESRPWKSRQSAAHALCELLRGDKKMSITLLENKQEFLVPLFHQLFSKMPVELSITLVHCLIALSIHEDIRVKLLESKLLEALLACLQEGKEADIELKIAVIHCLCGYICESPARDWFLNLGGVNKIVECLMNTSVPLRQAAATFLQLAAREPPIAVAFIHAGMLHWLAGLCGSLNSKRFLTDLFPIGWPVNTLNSIIVSSNRTECPSHSNLSYTLTISGDVHKGFIRLPVWTLPGGYHHEGTLCGFDWLDPLRHRMLDQKTMRRAIPIWETAIEALFSNYLPAKFAYMGRLDMTDVTEEGFYVTRHVERIFPILEELLVARLCPLRPIYVCNFKSTTPALHPSVGMGSKPVRE
uniref:Uncharacterized protein n=1 Tax=Timema cristinae TaxID=61476 RepID=A0A7R9D7T7_TIMCR|nr:unnamed protein product [Timema cristinae]